MAITELPSPVGFVSAGRRTRSDRRLRLLPQPAEAAAREDSAPDDLPPVEPDRRASARCRVALQYLD
ncbi:hypothetical protein [Kitasatospora sp. NPDC002040]|uniref:hypothetical protein n=1 Tax=Kitasatospora sp. NPDC002040 TaxID=3154661 RepID=UPI003329C718